jgi:hypothetical protein
MFYRLFVPAQAVGANLVYFDLFNATGSGSTLTIMSCLPIVSGAVAVAGVVGVDLFVTKTTTVGTGGTAATYEGSSLTACTITAVDGTQPISSLITARLTPAGGATAGAVITWRSMFTEETSSAAYMPGEHMIRNGYTDIPGITVRENSGIRVVQGSVASVGNIGFDVVFKN